MKTVNRGGRHAIPTAREGPACGSRILRQCDEQPRGQTHSKAPNMEVLGRPQGDVREQRGGNEFSSKVLEVAGIEIRSVRIVR